MIIYDVREFFFLDLFVLVEINNIYLGYVWFYWFKFFLFDVYYDWEMFLMNFVLYYIDREEYVGMI